jgi:glycine cleavage system H protein
MIDKNNLKYTKEHQWLSIEGNLITMGITEHAQESMGDILYVELPDADEDIEARRVMINIESVKALSELSFPIDCKIIDTNSMLDDEPELVNADPLGNGWMIKMAVDQNALSELVLLTQDEYYGINK